MLEDDKTAKTLCGTAEYFAPEMVNEIGHDRAVDWWALGILMYEMIVGETPFFDPNRKNLYDKIKYDMVVFPSRNSENKYDYSNKIADLIRKLLEKDKEERLGTKGGA